MGSDFQPAPIWLKFDRNDPDNTLFDNTLNRLTYFRGHPTVRFFLCDSLNRVRWFHRIDPDWVVVQ